MKNRSCRYWKYTFLGINILFILMPIPILAGPPFKTDDPQPVDYLHWEFYLASAQQYTGHEIDATCPHIEINYGAISNIQIHLVAPLGYVHTNTGTHYGYSDTEISIKYRVVQETEKTPQIGFFPLIEIPIGDEKRQLGNGLIQVYLPVWIQKSWDNLTTYGGGGIWYNPGLAQKNCLFTGWELQYDFSKIFTLGSEIYYQTAETQDSESSTEFTIGGFINLNEEYHILFSFGHNLSGENAFSGYIGFLLTIKKKTSKMLFRGLYHSVYFHISITSIV